MSRNSTATKKRYKIPPRNENTRNENITTTNDINNKHNIDNSKNYQTTTTTTKFLFNPILLFGTVSYDFISAPDITFISFSLFLRQNANLLQALFLLNFFLLFIYIYLYIFICWKKVLYKCIIYIIFRKLFFTVKHKVHYIYILYLFVHIFFVHYILYVYIIWIQIFI